MSIENLIGTAESEILEWKIYLFCFMKKVMRQICVRYASDFLIKVEEGIDTVSKKKKSLTLLRSFIDGWGDKAIYKIKGDEMYIRAEVVDSKGKRLFLQPVYV